MYPVYGFGGKLPGAQAASHCFALNGDIFSPEQNQVKGVLNSYFNARLKTQLYGPTKFSPVLKYVNDFVRAQSAGIS